MSGQSRREARRKAAAQRPDCLIIAAGMGSRLSALGEPKPLVPLLGRPLIDWVMEAATAGGVGSFHVVTGYLSERLEAHLARWSRTNGHRVNIIRNGNWRRENGLSVALGAPYLPGPFALLMSDHVFEPWILARLLAERIGPDEVILAVDRRLDCHPTVDLDDVTRVLTDGGRILAIGKQIPEYNAFDTGIFLGTPGLFAALEESFSSGDYSLSGGIRTLAARGKARVFEIRDGIWVDVDDQAAHGKAERLFRPASQP